MTDEPHKVLGAFLQTYLQGVDFSGVDLRTTLGADAAKLAAPLLPLSSAGPVRSRGTDMGKIEGSGDRASGGVVIRPMDWRNSSTQVVKPSSGCEPCVVIILPVVMKEGIW